MPVRGRDLVVGGAEVGRGDDEVHVEVGIVILLEVERSDLQRGQLVDGWQLGDDGFDTVLVHVLIGLLELRVGNRDLDAGFRTEFWYLE